MLTNWPEGVAIVFQGGPITAVWATGLSSRWRGRRRLSRTAAHQRSWFIVTANRVEIDGRSGRPTGTRRRPLRPQRRVLPEVNATHVNAVNTNGLAPSDAVSRALQQRRRPAPEVAMGAGLAVAWRSNDDKETVGSGDLRRASSF